MIIMGDTDKIVGNPSIKFVIIGDHTVAVHYGKLGNSVEDVMQCQFGDLALNQDYIDSLPPIDRSIDHITPEFLEVLPVIMFESPVYDGRYFRFDGRHRCIAIWKLGFKSVSAVWVPRLVWSRYIVDTRQNAKGQLAEFSCNGDAVVPLVWIRSPLARSDDDGFHYEPNFELPNR